MDGVEWGLARKCSVFIATSVDGFIADAGGGIDWLNRPEYDTGEAFGYDEFVKQIDAIVMGRHTFEKVLTFPEWPYAHPVVVLTSRQIDIPTHLQRKVTVDGGSPAEVAARMAEAGRGRLYIDGGVTVQRFLQAGLVDEMTITLVPILLGGGLPLFGMLGTKVRLQLLDLKRFDNGFVQVRYKALYGE